jgi:GST-like protein
VGAGHQPEPALWAEDFPLGSSTFAKNMRITRWQHGMIHIKARELVSFDALKHVPPWLNRGLARPAVVRGLEIPKRSREDLV